MIGLLLAADESITENDSGYWRGSALSRNISDCCCAKCAMAKHLDIVLDYKDEAGASIATKGSGTTAARPARANGIGVGRQWIVDDDIG